MDQWFIIRKSVHSVNNPWMGKEQQGGREFFGKLVDFLSVGGLTKFSTSDAAFQHIQKTHPTDVGIMQVYQMKETPDGIQLTHVRS
jgi:hypothetical protein